MERFQSCTLNGLLWQDLVAKTPFGGKTLKKRAIGQGKEKPNASLWGPLESIVSCYEIMTRQQGIGRILLLQEFDNSISS